MTMTLEEQFKILKQGTDSVISEDDLKRKLEKSQLLKKPLIVKLGADPTAPDLHLGHSVVLRKLRQFQDLGHKAVLIIGDYTALIGDPTGQNKTRPMLTAGLIDQNATTYLDQAGKILDTSPEKLEIRRNSEWFSKMNFADVLRLAARITVARMLERDTFAKRHKIGEPIGVHEFLYPLMQGYDSVKICSDIELGGTDQTFNNLVGRSLQKDENQEPQVVVLMPILEGTDGAEKMSKSKGNYIGLNDSPKDIFGKTMSISDELMWRWYQLLTDKTKSTIATLRQGHPMDAKKALAQILVAQYYGTEMAEAAASEFDQQFSQKNLDNIAESMVLPADTNNIGILELVEKIGKFKSRSEIRRLIHAGAVSLDGTKLTDEKIAITVKTGQVLKVGKLTVVKLQVGV